MIVHFHIFAIIDLFKNLVKLRYLLFYENFNHGGTIWFS